MPPTPEQTKVGYAKLWDRAKLNPQQAGIVRSTALKIIANKAKYMAVEAKTGVPWFMIGPIHNRESSLRFDAHLHCGDPLRARTFHVPKGRPATGSPPFTWEASAIDALTMAPHSLNKVKTWSVERILYETERYNGWGYLGKGNSPYLWAYTTEYNGGKYVADHVYDRNAWDKQLGCAALLKALAELDSGVALRLSSRQSGIPADIVPEDKEQSESVRKAQNARNVAGGAGAAGVGTESAIQANKPTGAPTGVMAAYVIPVAIALAVVVCIVAIVTIVRKRKQATADANTAWTGSPA